MKRNPVASYVRASTRAYARVLREYGEQAVEPLKQAKEMDMFFLISLRPFYLKLVDQLGNDTRTFIVESVDNVIGGTIDFYNDLHRRAGFEPMRFPQTRELHSTIRRDFLLRPFKGKTLDERVDHANHRLRVNILPLLDTYATATPGPDTVLSQLRQYFTGTHPIPGGTAARWNGRLIASELFRAYQYTAKEMLTALGVPKVRWRNMKEHGEGNPARDYDGKEYLPQNLPDYPYPCNDSYFVPIYQ